MRDGLLFAFMGGPCGQEALAVLAEFALRVEELSAAVVAERDESGVRFSARSKSSELSAFALVRRALAGLGSGGGHSHSAGGFVPAAADPGEDCASRKIFPSRGGSHGLAIGEGAVCPRQFAASSSRTGA